MLRFPHGDIEYRAPRVATANDPCPPGASPAEAVVHRHWPKGVPILLPRGVAQGIAASARVNHGRWVVSCPFCPGAQFACRGDPRFFCVDCLHVGTSAEGRFVRVLWPSHPEGIEETLAPRPASNRHWEPGESLEDLRAENVQHLGAGL